MKDDFPYEIRMAKRSEWKDAMALAWKTFLKYEASDYTPEGIRSFEDFITDNTLYRMFVMGSYPMLVALAAGEIVGMITLRNGSHISLLFVDESYHRRGIGKNLIISLCTYLLDESVAARTDIEDMRFASKGVNRITVNSSPYGVEFYHKVGFKDLDSEITKDGIRYTPMELTIS